MRAGSPIKFRLSRGRDPDGDPCRPDLSVWFNTDNDDDEVPCVTLAVAELWGQPERFVDLAPGEARQLAKALLLMADRVEAATEPPPATIVESPKRKLDRLIKERMRLAAERVKAEGWKPWPARRS